MQTRRGKAKKVSLEQFIQVYEKHGTTKYDYELAAEMNISDRYFAVLRKNYLDKIKGICENICKQIAVKQIKNLERIANAGDVRAIITILSIADVFRPTTQQEQRVSGNIDISVNISKTQPELLPSAVRQLAGRAAIEAECVAIAGGNSDNGQE